MYQPVKDKKKIKKIRCTLCSKVGLKETCSFSAVCGRPFVFSAVYCFYYEHDGRHPLVDFNKIFWLITLQDGHYYILYLM